MRRNAVLLTLGGLLVGALLAAGLSWFQPWKLWVDDRVDEALPALALDAATIPATAPTTVVAPARTDPSTASRASGFPAARPGATTSTVAPVDRLLLRGRLISHEHATSGTVSIVRRGDGSRVLAIADLDTSNGPDVKVWLTDAPVLRGRAGWHVFDDGRHVSLGSLKGNLGNQLYAIPPSLDLTGLTSVTLWCDRFDVSFGAAELAAP